MVRQIRGRVVALEATGAVIEVAGFGVFVAMPSLSGVSLGAEVALATHLAVKQDALELYGFADSLDRDFFEKLLIVPGVGPKTALSILRKSSRSSLETAIAKRDINYLTRVAGLGKKAAEKLAVELAEKFTASESQGEDTEVFDTLVALGYTEREARKAVQSIPEEVLGKAARLKAALSGK